MKSIRWGIIGCGDVTEKKSGPAFNKISNSSLLAVMRRDLAKAQDYAQRYQVPEAYDNANQIINHPDIDAVYIATPPNSHIEYARKTLEKNKAVYIEKPLGIAYSECSNFLDFFKQQKQPAWVAYYRRALPYFLKVKEIIDSGILGKIFHVDIKLHKPPGKNDSAKTKPWRVNPEIGGGGYFWDLAPHQIDLLVYYFGKVLQTEGKASNTGRLYDAEDTVAAFMLLENEITVAGSWNFVSDKNSFLDEFKIFGTDAVVSFSCFQMNTIEIQGKINKKFRFKRPPIIQEHFIREITKQLTEESSIKTNISDAVHVNKVLEKCTKNYYS